MMGGWGRLKRSPLAVVLVELDVSPLYLNVFSLRPTKKE